MVLEHADMPEIEQLSKLQSTTSDAKSSANQSPSSLDKISEEEEKRPLLGLFLSFLSCLFYSLTAVIVKGLKPVNGAQILTIRGLIQVIIYLYLVFKFKNPLFGILGHRFDLFIRGVLGSLSLNFVYIAFLHISLGDATAIQNMSPIYVIFLAFFILNEPISFLQLVIALICCFGAILVARPQVIWNYFEFYTNTNITEQYQASTQHSDTLGFSMAFFCSIFSAIAFIWIRKLRQTPVYTVTLHYSILMVIISAIFLPFTKAIVWPLSFEQWVKLLATGLFGTIDQICLTLSLKYENAGIISVSRTITIVMTYLWDVAFFNIIPPWTSLLGGGMIIFSLITIAISRPGVLDVIKKRCNCLNFFSSEKTPILSNDRKTSRSYYS